MARQESDREDLMREATAWVRRAEFRVPGEAEEVVVGFRAHGGLSIYFGADPVYQFDPQNRLRRGFVDGRLYRTQQTTLAQLTRLRTETESILQRYDLSPSELGRFLDQMRERLRSLHEALVDGTVQTLRQIPADADLQTELQQRLTSLLERSESLAPRIPGKR